MNVKNRRQLRRQASEIQNFHCYYCHLPTWEKNPDQFSRTHGIPLRLTKYLRCTAEHLIAQQDKGRDTLENIVSACLWCNQGRHRGRQDRAPDPASHKSKISKLVAQGKWHPVVASRRAKA